MEPIFRREILKHLPEQQASQLIFKCGNQGLGLSCINAKGSRFGDRGHNIYCSEDTYEVALIRFNNPVPELNPTDYELVNSDELKNSNVIGWLSPEEVGALAEDVERQGLEGFTANLE